MNRIVAIVAVVVLVLPVFGAEPGGMTGRLLGVDGRPAAGFQVVLVSADGQPADKTGTDYQGAYSFDQVSPGEYGIGIISPEGDVSPVLAAPTPVTAGEVVVRDIRLLTAGDSPVLLAPASGGLGVWWAGLSPGAKVWTVMGTLVGIGLVYGATQDDDNRSETPVTPFRVD